MKIVFVSQFYSEGMGYTENILPKYLSKLGHEVVVLASDLQVYGNTPEYASNYEGFLGPAKCEIGEYTQEGFILHRLRHYSINEYIGLRGLSEALKVLCPDVVQFSQAAGLDTFTALIRPQKLLWPIFTECHQHASIARNPQSSLSVSQIIKNIGYRATRTLPSWLAHKRVEKCFAIAPDCEEIAQTLYGVPAEKLVLLPLGTDTDLFHPCESDYDQIERNKVRKSFGVQEDDILIVYTGRFSHGKNPLILAKAVDKLRQQGMTFAALFVGSGVQQDAIQRLSGSNVIGFQKQAKLAALYRAADIGVWPREESMSMLDAAATGLPLVVSENMGEQERVNGSGLTYSENDINSLILMLSKLTDRAYRLKLGSVGRQRMIASFSWRKHAESRIAYYQKALSAKRML